MSLILKSALSSLGHVFHVARERIYPQISPEAQQHCLQAIQQSVPSLDLTEQEKMVHNPLWGGFYKREICLLETKYPSALPKLLSLKDREGEKLFKNLSEVLQFLKKITSSWDFEQLVASFTNSIFSAPILSAFFFFSSAFLIQKFQNWSQHPSIPNALDLIEHIPQETLQQLAQKHTRETLAQLISSEEDLHLVSLYPETEVLHPHEAFALSLLGRLDWNENSSLPKALILMTSNDPDGPTNPLRNKDFYKSLSRDYNVRVRLVATKEQLNHEIALVAEKIVLLYLEAHGSRKALDFGEVINTETPLPALKALPDHSIVILGGCSNGEGKETKLNFANYIASIAPQSTVYAGITPNSGCRITETGEIRFPTPLDLPQVCIKFPSKILFFLDPRLYFLKLIISCKAKSNFRSIPIPGSRFYRKEILDTDYTYKISPGTMTKEKVKTLRKSEPNPFFSTMKIYGTPFAIGGILGINGFYLLSKFIDPKHPVYSSIVDQEKQIFVQIQRLFCSKIWSYFPVPFLLNTSSHLFSKLPLFYQITLPAAGVLALCTFGPDWIQKKIQW